MKSIFLSLLGAIFLVSCNGSINTSLKVHQSIKLNTRYSGQVVFNPGSHKVKLSVDEKSKYIKFDFPQEKNDPVFPDDGDNWRDRSHEVRFNYPKDVNFPKDNGEIRLTPQESGQPVYLEGVIKTVVNRGELTRNFESCEIQRRRTECHTDREGRTFCRDYWETVFGRRDVEYYPVITTKTVNVMLFGNENGEVAADLSARQSSEAREYVYQGFCRY